MTESYRVGSTVALVLRDDTSGHIVREVGFYENWFLRVEVDENGYTGEGSLQPLKRVFGGRGPFELNALLGQSC